MFDFKKGTIKYLLYACLDTFPTKTNLLQWGKTPVQDMSRCKPGPLGAQKEDHTPYTELL